MSMWQRERQTDKHIKSILVTSQNILGQKLEFFPRGVQNFTDQYLKKIGEKRPTKKAKKIFRPSKKFLKLLLFIIVITSFFYKPL